MKRYLRLGSTIAIVLILNLCSGDIATAQTDTASTSVPLAEIVKKYLQSKDWKYAEVESKIEGKTIYKIGFQGKNINWTSYAMTKEKQQFFYFYSVLKNNVPEDKRAEVAEFLHRANYNLIIGNFEIDFSDGEVRFKTSIDVEGGTLTDTMIKNMIQPNLSKIDEYSTGLMKVIYGDLSPEKAIREIEEN